MPRTRFDKPKYPPIDLLKAVILERKMVMKLSYDDIASHVGVSTIHLRRLMTTENTNDWNPDIRKAVCKMLGIGIQTTLTQITDDNGIKMN